MLCGASVVLTLGRILEGGSLWREAAGATLRPAIFRRATRPSQDILRQCSRGLARMRKAIIFDGGTTACRPAAGGCLGLAEFCCSFGACQEALRLLGRR